MHQSFSAGIIRICIAHCNSNNFHYTYDLIVWHSKTYALSSFLWRLATEILTYGLNNGIITAYKDLIIHPISTGSNLEFSINAFWAIISSFSYFIFRKVKDKCRSKHHYFSLNGRL